MQLIAVFKSICIKHVPVKVGDTIITSGYSQIFPRNVLIGTVKSVKSYPEKTFMDVTVKLSTDFGNLGYVYIAKNMRKQEIQLLDSLANRNEKP